MAVVAPMCNTASLLPNNAEVPSTMRRATASGIVAPPGLSAPPGLPAPSAASGKRPARQPAAAAAFRPKERGSKHSATFTTVMLCNLNGRDDTLEVVRILQSRGWENTFDFCHKPRQSNKSGCKPYAFVNFKSHEAAARFKADSAHGFQVEVADVQGLDANCKGWARSNFREGGRIKSNGIHDRRLWPWVEDSTLWQKFHTKSRAGGGASQAKDLKEVQHSKDGALHAKLHNALVGAVPDAYRRESSGGSTASGRSSSGSQVHSSDDWGPAAWSSARSRGGSPTQGSRGPSPLWSPRSSQLQAIIPFDPLEPALLVLTGLDDA